LPTELIIDTDAGIDDSQAIMLALGHSDVELAAITTLSGNVHVDKVTRNVRTVLDIMGRSVPVYRGADRPLVQPHLDAEEFMGRDGLGDVGFPEPRSKIEDEHAVLALIRMAAANPGHYTLMCIGPLTNVALAIRLDPNFPNNIGRFLFMGGAYEARGNTKIVSEFNIHFDPEAAAVVLSEFPYSTMISWELSVNYGIPWAEFDPLYARKGKKVEFFCAINRFLENVMKKYDYTGMAMPDQLTAAVAADPSLILERTEAHVQVELAGALTRGQTIVDWRGRTKPQVNIVTKIDKERFWKMMVSALDVKDL
jgi:purine nucleosidase